MSRRSLIVLASVVIALATSAVAAGSGGKKAQAPQLKGTWLTAVALTNPPPGVDATFQALDTFVPGGGILVSSSQSHPVARSLAHGTCAHAQGQDFTCTFVWFRFDPVTGVFAGSQRVRRTMTLSADRQSFQATDTIDLVAPDGTVIASLHGTETGHRLGS